ncbi:MAG: NAD-binding protein, partial [Opitutales bacterium]
GLSSVPMADSELKPSDVVTIVGPPEALYELRPKFEPQSRPEGSVRVVLFGGSETAIALVRLLKSPRFKVRLIESDKEACQQLAETFPDVTVIHGSATSLRLLEEEQVGSADYFVACTKDDEDNIMTALQARKLGVKGVMLIFNKPDYEGVLDQLRGTLGVELAVSPRQATVAEVIRYLSKRDYHELASLPKGSGKIIEVRVSEKSAVINTPLKDVELPRGCVIIVLMHRFQSKVPGAEDKLLPEDRLVIIVQEDKVQPLVELLCPRE